MSKHTPGPWQWNFRNLQSGYELIHPHKGYLLVMDFTRLGMRGGQPRFATWHGDERGSMGGVMRKAEELMPLDQHPDARLIAAAPLLAKMLRELLAASPEPQIVSFGFDNPPEAASAEDHEYDRIRFECRNLLESIGVDK